ncbi:MAG TPA: hypothetical protein VK255_03325, partial [Patescibacteria group bacterium]|nr:hypothetical protein [Patescibacteria group bacterium]
DWDHYTTHEPTFRPEVLSPRKMFMHSIWAHLHFYGLNYFHKHLTEGRPNSKFYTAMGIYAHSVLWPQLIKAVWRKFEG